MSLCVPDYQSELDPQASAFYRQTMQILDAAQVPFLVGGAYALAQYVGISRHTKDLDIFVRPHDCARVFAVLEEAGHTTELTFPHWLGKAYYNDYFVDVIFSSGNGLVTVDDTWFSAARAGEVFGLPVQLCAPEEIVWSKAYVMERERYDGADIMHLLRACGPQLDWQRLLQRFGPYWRVLFSYLTLFGFVYPAEQAGIPPWVIQELMQRFHDELSAPQMTELVCQGTLISRAQYLVDIDAWGYRDARLVPQGGMTAADIAHWTMAIAEAKEGA